MRPSIKILDQSTTGFDAVDGAHSAAGPPERHLQANSRPRADYRTPRLREAYTNMTDRFFPNGIQSHQSFPTSHFIAVYLLHDAMVMSG